MKTDRTNPLLFACRYRAVLGFMLVGALLVALPMSSAVAYSNPAPVPLASAGAFTVLAGTAVTNTGDTVISADAGIGGNLGVSPGSAVTGFPPGVVTPPGAIHASAPADALATTAHDDAGLAFDNAAGRTPDQTFPLVYDLVGQTFTAGVYNGPSSLALSGTVTLDGENNPDAVFIFQSGSTLGTSAASAVRLINGAQACNVFWAVGSSATLGANSTFNGTILAAVAVTIGDSVTFEGRVFAGSAAITLANDRIHTPACAPESGVPLASLFGGFGPTIVVGAFVAGVGALVIRRRLLVARIR